MNPRLHATTERHHPARRRWRVAVALALGVALGLTGNAAVAAAQEAGSDPSAAAAAPGGRVVDFPMNRLWTNQYSSYGDTYWRQGADIFIGSDTRTLVLDVEIEAPGPVICQPTTDYSEMPPVTWTAQEWASDDFKTVGITEDFIDEIGDHILACTSTSADGQRWWTLQWWLSPEPTDLGAVVVLAQDEQLLSSYQLGHVYTTLGDPRPVSSGDTVRLTGAAGTWPQGPNPWGQAVDPVITLFSGASETESVTVADAVIAPDGSTLEFVVPAAPTPGFFTEDATFSVHKAHYTDGFNGEPYLNRETATWSAPLVFAAQPASTVAVSLNSRYALSYQQLTATAIVKSVGSPSATGTVSFAVNGKAVGAVPLTAASQGKVSFRLPALAKGQYSITATFTPGAGAAPAVSPGAWLRVLR